MTELAGSVDYLVELGLREAPFYPLPDSAGIIGSVREQSFMRLSHLARFGEQMLVVTATSGGGKSFFLRLLATDLVDIPKVITLDARQCDDQAILLEQLLVKLLPAMAGNMPEGVGALLAFIRSHLSSQFEPPILLLDDAQCLEDPALAMIQSLMLGGGKLSLKVVMFGTPELTSRLDALNGLDVVLYDLPLEPIVLDQWLGFVHKRLHDCGLEGALPITADDVADAQVSAGNNIEQMLMELEQALSSKTPVVEAPGLRLGLPPLHFVALIALLAVLVIVGFTGERLFGGGPTESELTAQKLPLEPPQGPSKRDQGEVAVGGDASDKVELAISAQPESNDANGDQAVAGAEAQSQSEAQSEPMAVLRSDTPVAGQPVVTLTQPRQPAVQEQVSDDPPSSQGDILSENQVQSQSVAEPVAPASELARPQLGQATEKSVQTDKASDDRARLLAVADEHFVLQIMAAQNLDAVRSFIQQQDNRKDLALITQDRSGQHWYVVITGDYRTQALARSAIATLPKSQQSNGPWPRNALELKQYLAED